MQTPAQPGHGGGDPLSVLARLLPAGRGGGDAAPPGCSHPGPGETCQVLLLQTQTQQGETRVIRLCYPNFRWDF